MVKRYYYKQFVEECINKKGEREVCIWGMRRTGRDILNVMCENNLISKDEVHLIDRDLCGSEWNGFIIENPDIFINNTDRFFIMCTAEMNTTAYKMAELIFGQGFKDDPGIINDYYGNFIFYIENIVKCSPKLIEEERIEFANMMATMYSHQNYISDLIVEGDYKNVAPITTKIGCPISCKYCPQDVLIKSYLKRKELMDCAF